VLGNEAMRARHPREREHGHHQLSLYCSKRQRRSVPHRGDGDGIHRHGSGTRPAGLVTGGLGAPVPFVICPKGWIPAPQKL
jgi:hypothetical protein